MFNLSIEEKQKGSNLCNLEDSLFYVVSLGRKKKKEKKEESKH